MGIQVKWFDDEKTIIQHEFDAEWTWDDYYAIIEKSVAMERTVQHPVYIISVNPPNVKIPSGNALRHFQRGFTLHLPNVRFIAVMTNNTLIVLFGRTLLRIGIINSRARLVQSVDEALRLIHEDKEQLRRQKST